jgi:hypothetical protein
MPARETPLPRWLIPLEVALLLAIFMLQAGWPAPEVNEPHYLGKAKHFWNGHWAAHDFFFESADTHRVFYLACGWPTRWLTLSQFAWCGRLFTWLLLAVAWQRLCRAVVGRAGWSVFAGGIFIAFNVGCHLAGEWVVGGFEAKGLAYALVLAALTAVVGNRWNTALLLLGGASAIHVLVGGWSALATGLCWLLSTDRPPLARLAPGILGGTLLALPGILPAVALNWTADAQTVAEANDIYVFRRLAHHLAPTSFRWPFLARYLAMLLLWLALNVRRTDNASLRRLRTFVVASLAIALTGLALGLITASYPQTAAALLRYYWFRLADVMLPVGIAMSAAVGLAGDGLKSGAESPKSKVQSPKFWRRGFAWLAGCGALMVYAHDDYAAWNLFQNTPRADKSGKVLNHDDWRAACQWMAEHTPPDALAITPRLAQTFTWYAGRGEVVSWKDLPQDAVAVVRWWQRLEDIYATGQPDFQRRWHESLTELSPKRLRELGRKYHADYLLVEADPAMDLPPLYRNDSYAVYRLVP